MRLRLALLLVTCTVIAAASSGTANAATLPSGFQERTVFSGLTNPMNVEFASDGRVFVAEKSGLIKVFDNLSDTTPTTFADLRTQVHNFWDRGMLGMTLSPNFPADPYVYVLYTHDAAIGGTAPRWGTAGATSDGCPTPPGPTSDGCVVSGRLSRLTASGNQMTGPEKVLVEDWCQQYPSHSVGDLAFGADGALYASAGDGASFTFTDWGQDGSPVNPCGDPPGGAGGVMNPPLAEGGALRAQDVRTGGATSPGGTAILRPDSNVTQGWTSYPWDVTPTWEALNDPVTSPAFVDDSDFIYAGDSGQTTEVGLGTTSLGGAQPTAGKAWLYMNIAPNQSVRADVIWGGSVRATKTFEGGASGAGFSWQSIDVLPPNQAAVDDLRIRITTQQNATSGSNVRAAYFELTTAGTSSDPTGLDGSVIRVDPATGEGLPGNPYASSADPNARRIVAYGLRNPFRFTFKPGTNELWLGDVGWSTWEEINKFDPAGSAENFGWPCYEGAGRQGGYDSADLSICETLYSSGSVASPFFAWNHAIRVVSTDQCPGGGSSASGAAFYTGGPFPDAYDGAFIFSDYSRGCIWSMLPQGGQPSPSSLVTLVDGGSAVDLEVSSDGELYYADFDGGTIRKVSYASGNRPPTAVATANPATGPAPLAVQFNGSGSSDPDAGDTLSYAWDLDNDSQFDDSTAINPSRTYQAGTHVARLRVTDRGGLTHIASVTVTAGNSPPVPRITAPTGGTTWQVGSIMQFAGTATDSQDGTLGSSRLSWRLDLDHCPSNCHTHQVQSYSGVSSGSFTAPDHEYPSKLVLRLTATDSGGLSASTSVTLDPRTYALTLQSSNPSGLSLSLNGITAQSRFTRTVIRGSTNTISAPTPQTSGGRNYRFSRWSDYGAQTHDIVATATRTYTAYYTRTTSTAASTRSCKANGKKKKSKSKRKRCLRARAAGG